ncbi:MAG: hypothetical protein WBV63_15015, partial [Candidatus Sulfotelmatobacter sp.]
ATQETAIIVWIFSIASIVATLITILASSFYSISMKGTWFRASYHAILFLYGRAHISAGSKVFSTSFSAKKYDPPFGSSTSKYCTHFLSANSGNADSSGLPRLKAASGKSIQS